MTLLDIQGQKLLDTKGVKLSGTNLGCLKLSDTNLGALKLLDMMMLGCQKLLGMIWGRKKLIRRYALKLLENFLGDLNMLDTFY